MLIIYWAINIFIIYFEALENPTTIIRMYNRYCTVLSWVKRDLHSFCMFSNVPSSHSLTHWWQEITMQAGSFSSGVITIICTLTQQREQPLGACWGSVSRPGTLRHADCRWWSALPTSPAPKTHWWRCCDYCDLDVKLSVDILRRISFHGFKRSVCFCFSTKRKKFRSREQTQRKHCASVIFVDMQWWLKMQILYLKEQGFDNISWKGNVSRASNL